MSAAKTNKAGMGFRSFGKQKMRTLVYTSSWKSEENTHFGSTLKNTFHLHLQIKISSHEIDDLSDIRHHAGSV